MSGLKYDGKYGVILKPAKQSFEPASSGARVTRLLDYQVTGGERAEEETIRRENEAQAPTVADWGVEGR